MQVYRVAKHCFDVSDRGSHARHPPLPCELPSTLAAMPSYLAAGQLRAYGS